MRRLSRQLPAMALCVLSMLGAQPALAQYSTGSEEASAQRVLDEINTFLDKANTAIDEGEAAENEGHYATACEAYRRAIAYNESAISAHLGYSANEGVSYRKISDSIDNIRRHTNNIESSAGRVCGKNDPSPTYSSPSDATESDQEPELYGTAKDIWKSNRLVDASRHYFFDLGNIPEGCIAARKALFYSAKVVLEWEYVLDDADEDQDIKNLHANVSRSQGDLERFACPPATPAEARAFNDEALKDVVSPAIDRLNVYIEQTRAERLATDSLGEVNRQYCLIAQQSLNMVGAKGEEALLCQAMAYWLEDDAAQACGLLDRDDLKDFFRRTPSADLVSYRDRLYVAAACGPKIITQEPVATPTPPVAAKPTSTPKPRPKTKTKQH